MLETLLIIILLPLAIVVICGMAIAAFVLWKLIAAVLLWAAALVMFLMNHGDTSGSLFWWAFGSFMLGCWFVVSWQSDRGLLATGKEHSNGKHGAKGTRIKDN